MNKEGYITVQVELPEDGAFTKKCIDIIAGEDKELKWALGL